MHFPAPIVSRGQLFQYFLAYNGTVTDKAKAWPQTVPGLCYRRPTCLENCSAWFETMDNKFVIQQSHVLLFSTSPSYDYSALVYHSDGRFTNGFRRVFMHFCMNATTRLSALAWGTLQAGGHVMSTLRFMPYSKGKVTVSISGVITLPKVSSACLHKRCPSMSFPGRVQWSRLYNLIW